jgi:predicted nucleic acid-binding protein
MIYWDTSAILPLYIEEPTTPFWESQILALEGDPRSSALVITEFSFTLRHKVLRGHIKAISADRVVAKFAQDCAAGRWRLCPLGSDVIEASLEVAKISYRSKNPVALRSLDGLHLGAAQVLKCDTIATGDERLASAAKRVGVRVLSV